MTEITRILNEIAQGDPQAAQRLLPFVYNELRRLAAQKLAHEKPGHTLQATALVHEAYVRLVDGDRGKQNWDSRGHFFAAAAEAMRRILVESARHKHATKRNRTRESRFSLDQVAAPESSEDLLALNDALDKLSAADSQAAELVKLRFFAGLTIREAAACLGISARTADNYWAYAKAWLLREIEDGGRK